MILRQAEPAPPFRDIVRSYWYMESEDTALREQKIIPDGFPELIFHFGDPFRINLDSQWKLQKKQLLAGQITRYFYLQNTGRTGIFALKLQPWAGSYFFHRPMRSLMDQVVSLSGKPKSIFSQLADSRELSFRERIELSEKILSEFHPQSSVPVNFKVAVNRVVEEKGMMAIADLSKITGISERSMERYFQYYIGLSPKFYCRVIRLSHIFRLVSERGSWSDISYQAGFYDQAHFIRDFREFIGEEPSRYGFDEKNMANFFLRP